LAVTRGWKKQDSQLCKQQLLILTMPVKFFGQVGWVLLLPGPVTPAK